MCCPTHDKLFLREIVLGMRAFFIVVLLLSLLFVKSILLVLVLKIVLNFYPFILCLFSFMF